VIKDSVKQIIFSVESPYSWRLNEGEECGKETRNSRLWDKIAAANGGWEWDGGEY